MFDFFGLHYHALLPIFSIQYSGGVNAYWKDVFSDTSKQACHADPNHEFKLMDVDGSTISPVTTVTTNDNDNNDKVTLPSCNIGMSSLSSKTSLTTSSASASASATLALALIITNMRNNGNHNSNNKKAPPPHSVVAATATATTISEAYTLASINTAVACIASFIADESTPISIQYSGGVNDNNNTKRLPLPRFNCDICNSPWGGESGRCNNVLACGIRCKRRAEEQKINDKMQKVREEKKRETAERKRKETAQAYARNNRDQPAPSESAVRP